MKYFVSYTFSGKDGQGFGFGRTDIEASFPILSAADIANIEKIIAEKTPDISRPIVLNWKEY